MEFKLDDRIIKRIGWELSEYMPEDYNVIEVGEEGVTRIDAIVHHLGEYQICWVQVWKDSSLVARYNARNIDSIIYEEE